MIITNNPSYRNKYENEKTYLESLQAQLSHLEREQNITLPHLDDKLNLLKRKISGSNLIMNQFCSDLAQDRLNQLNTDIANILIVIEEELKHQAVQNLQNRIEKSKQNISYLGYILSLEHSLAKKATELQSLKIQQDTTLAQMQNLEKKVKTLKEYNSDYKNKYKFLKEESSELLKKIFACTIFSAVALLGFGK